MNIYGTCCRPGSNFTNFEKKDLNSIDMEIEKNKLRFEPFLNDGVFTLLNQKPNYDQVNKINEEIKFYEEQEKQNNEKIIDLTNKIKMIEHKISSMNKMLEIDICERDYIDDFITKKLNNKNNITPSYYQN